MNNNINHTQDITEKLRAKMEMEAPEVDTNQGVEEEVAEPQEVVEEVNEVQEEDVQPERVDSRTEEQKKRDSAMAAMRRELDKSRKLEEKIKQLAPQLKAFNFDDINSSEDLVTQLEEALNQHEIATAKHRIQNGDPQVIEDMIKKNKMLENEINSVKTEQQQLITQQQIEQGDKALLDEINEFNKTVGQQMGIKINPAQHDSNADAIRNSFKDIEQIEKYMNFRNSDGSYLTLSEAVKLANPNLGNSIRGNSADKAHLRGNTKSTPASDIHIGDSEFNIWKKMFDLDHDTKGKSDEEIKKLIIKSKKGGK
jgi:hypothetical protein